MNDIVSHFKIGSGLPGETPTEQIEVKRSWIEEPQGPVSFGFCHLAGLHQQWQNPPPEVGMSHSKQTTELGLTDGPIGQDLKGLVRLFKSPDPHRRLDSAALPGMLDHKHFLIRHEPMRDRLERAEVHVKESARVQRRNRGHSST